MTRAALSRLGRRGDTRRRAAASETASDQQVVAATQVATHDVAPRLSACWSFQADGALVSTWVATASDDGAPTWPDRAATSAAPVVPARVRRDRRGARSLSAHR